VGRGVQLHCWGEFACFTRPEMKVERVSYDAMTPSAARAVLEAVYWKPEIRWVIDSITVLQPIHFTSIRRNEVKDKISAATALKVMRAGRGSLGIVASDGKVRQQRAALLLRDVSYLIDAHFDIVSGPENAAKHLDQFQRRARTGACFTRPYLGCREFAAHFVLHKGEPPVTHESLKGERDLGWMLHDIDFSHDRQARFFHARMRDGVIDVPPFAQARA